MKPILIFLLFFSPKVICAQIIANDKCVYSVEGIISGCSSSQVIQQAIITNPELGITTQSDENGYYNITFPLNFLDSGKSIRFEVLKEDYKPSVWWLSYNSMESNTNNRMDNCVVRNFDLKMVRLSKSNESKVCYVSSYIRIDTLRQGYLGVKASFEHFIKRNRMHDELELLKAKNEDLIFKIDGKYVVCSSDKATFLNNEKVLIFVNGKKVKVENVNKILKRSETIENSEKRDIYYKKHKNPKTAVFYFEKKLV